MSPVSGKGTCSVLSAASRSAAKLSFTVASNVPAVSILSLLVARRKPSRFIARPGMLAAGDNLGSRGTRGCRSAQIPDPEVWQWGHTGFTVMSGDSK